MQTGRKERNLGTIITTNSFYSQVQDNLCKLISESQTMVDFAAARYDGHSSSDKCNSNKTCKAPVKSPPSTHQNPTYHSVDALPVTQPSVRALKAWKQTRELQINIYMWIFKELQLRHNCSLPSVFLQYYSVPESFSLSINSQQCINYPFWNLT